MALFYVTGAPGAGKTTVQKELSLRGYDARDLDDSDLGGAHNKNTGARIIIPSAHQRSPEWFEVHEWRVYPDAFNRLKTEAAHKDIILCGIAATDGKILHLFDKILYLHLDEDTLRHRLASRIDNDYGKNDFERQEIIERKRDLDKKYAVLDIIEIDALKPIGNVADEIVLQIKKHVK